MRALQSALRLVHRFVFTVPSHNCILSAERFQPPGGSRLDSSLDLPVWNLHVVLKPVWVLLTGVFLPPRSKTMQTGLRWDSKSCLRMSGWGVSPGW